MREMMKRARGSSCEIQEVTHQQMSDFQCKQISVFTQHEVRGVSRASISAVLRLGEEYIVKKLEMDGD